MYYTLAENLKLIVLFKTSDVSTVSFPSSTWEAGSWNISFFANLETCKPYSSVIVLVWQVVGTMLSGWVKSCRWVNIPGRAKHSRASKKTACKVQFSSAVVLDIISVYKVNCSAYVLESLVNVIKREKFLSSFTGQNFGTICDRYWHWNLKTYLHA